MNWTPDSIYWPVMLLAVLSIVGLVLITALCGSSKNKRTN